MAKTPARTPANLVKIEAKGTRLLTPLEEAVEALTIDSDDGYREADALLHTITRAEKDWDAEMEPILKPLREAKTAADALKRKVADPLKTLASSLRRRMGAWMTHKTALAAQAQAEQDAARDTAQRELEEAAAKEQTARTQQMREKLAARREVLEDRVEALETPVETVPVADHSTTRTIRKWRLADRENGYETILWGIQRGLIPANVLTIDESFVNRQPIETVAGWPGFEVYEESIIVRRRS